MRNEYQKLSFQNKLLNEGFFDKVAAIGKDIALSIQADYHERSAAIAEQNYKAMKRRKQDHLFPIYAEHLGMTPTEIKTVINEYPKQQPILDVSQMTVKTAKGHEPNPLWGAHVRDWQIRDKQFKERNKIIKSIKGFHKFNPRIKEMDQNYSRLMEKYKKARDEADPIIEVDGVKTRTSSHLRRQANLARSNKS